MKPGVPKESFENCGGLSLEKLRILQQKRLLWVPMKLTAWV